MKTLMIAILSMMVLLGAGFPNLLYAVEAPEAAADHQAMVEAYHEKAALQDALIAEHLKMKADNKRFYVNEKVTPSFTFAKMQNHCDAIIADARKLRDDFLDFAKWHEMRAAELK